MTKTCPVCGATFTMNPSRPAQKYCSRKCNLTASSRAQNARKRAARAEYLRIAHPVPRTCPVCGDVFTPHAQTGRNHVYCSIKCRRHVWHEKEKAARRAAKAGRKCAWCGADISHRIGSARYCSWQCKNAAGYHERRTNLTFVEKREQTGRDSYARVRAYLSLPASERWAQRETLTKAELKLAEKLYTEGHVRTVTYNTLAH